MHTDTTWWGVGALGSREAGTPTHLNLEETKRDKCNTAPNCCTLVSF